MPAGKLLWEPDSGTARRANISSYMKWLEKRGNKFEDYRALWRWSVDDIEGFWASVWKYFDVSDVDYVPLRERRMPGAKWFDGAELNFAERVFSKKGDGPALVGRGEKGAEKRMTWQELERKTSALASKLREMGVAPGDRVAAFLPNVPEAVVGLLASASVGAVWSSCSPDFGAPAVVDRFGQIRPKVLLATDGYSYGGKWYDRTDVVGSIVKSMPTVEHVIAVQGTAADGRIEGAIDWGEATGGREKPEYELVPFDHPLWVLYSSGTTGLPKPIVHGQGGILLEHLKVLSLHNDIRAGDRLFWFTTTGWMMWNYLVGGLLHGATLVLYNGSPAYPDMNALWDLVDKTGITFMGSSAAYISSCMKSGIEPKSTHGLAKLRGVGSTGSPLSHDGFEWVYEKVKGDVWLASVSGGTDVCTLFVGGCPTLPVHSGEIQCRCLGAKVEAFDESGFPVIGRVGELVITEPMPSMPLLLWGDEDGSRYAQSYFESFPGVWRHGDWVEITKRGTCIILGRSDATIKRMGVRIGTSEIYRAVESLPEVAECLAIGLEGPGEEQEMVLFVVPAKGGRVDEALKGRIREKVKLDLSPRHVPDRIVEVPSVPHTLSGKKLEIPVKKVFMGVEPEKAANLGSLANPESLEYFSRLARSFRGDKKV
ncbi:MAG TPA: acetoacetate--CoA ligase [Nitrososphaerales archaeon]|nr:acetoacetate--CoA ligase [Nitrososphaerales archaeon]